MWGRAIVSPVPPPHSLESPLPRLVLVGTVHGDPQGYARAWRLLEYFQPDLITVEISPFSVRYRLRQERRWQQRLKRALAALPPEAREHLAIRRLKAQVALPFELRVARDWRKARTVSWRPLDLGGPARRHLPRYESELLRPDNLRALLATPDGDLTEWVAGEFQRARRSWQRAPWRLSTRDGEDRRREDFLARRLRRLAGLGLRMVHLGGWGHLGPWGGGSGLATALADLEPLKLLLEDAHLLPPPEEAAGPDRMAQINAG